MLLMGDEVFAQDNHRSAEEAQGIAEMFLISKDIHWEGISVAGTRNAKARDGAGQTEESSYYVFNIDDEQGYVIVSADKGYRNILGFCDYGSFDEGEMPDALKYWLGMFETEMKSFAPSKRNETDTDYDYQPGIEPLLKSNWGQGTPFNNLIPVTSTVRADGRAAAGCVAIAMGQVMNYWEHPFTPTGRKGNANYSGGSTFVYFPMEHYYWDKILDNYGSYTATGSANTECTQEYTEEQANEVAKLIYHCGVTTDMTWGDQSSAGNTTAMSALMTYFKYNKFMHAEARDVYSHREFRDILLNELNEGRPVMYWAKSDKGAAHYFVCDGYDNKTDMFHFNWGWNGQYNGYYPLSALDPETQEGYKSGLGAFNYLQFACVGCQPDTEGEYQPVFTASTMTLNEDVPYGNAATITMTNFINSSVGFEGDIGIALIQDGEIKYSSFNKALDHFGSSEYFSSYTMKSPRLNSDVKDGEYLFAVVAQLTTGEYWIVKANYGTPYMWKMNIESGSRSITFTKIIDEDGIADDIASCSPRQTQVRAIEYFSLSGTKVPNPSHGVFIKKTTYCNGTAKVNKVVNNL